MPVNEKNVEGIKGLVDEVIGIISNLPANSVLWYRGHSKSEHRLMPTLMRDGKTAEDVFDRERRLLTRFRQRSLPFWPAGYPQDDWEHMFAMQHFGIPTRLLDWSENLFVALYFAISNTTEDAATPVVYCLNPVSWNQCTPTLGQYGPQIQVLTTSEDESEPYRPTTNRRRNKVPIAIFGTHNSPRIVAQRGTFVVWGNEPKDLEEFAEASEDIIWKIMVTGDRSSMRRELNLLGFNETMIFPELSYLGLELARVEGWR